MLFASTGWAGGLGRTVSFKSLTSKEDAKAFYADGGKRYAGKRVHIHVPASCIHEKPLRSLVTKGGVRYLVFKNRNVPLAARANDVYLRKARQRTTTKDTLCVKGTVEKDGAENATGYVIRVTRVTKAP